MEIDILPIKVTRIANNKPKQNEFVYIEGITINYSNFMGPTPLALPFATDWRFTIGNIKGEISPLFIPFLGQAAESFGITFADIDNRLCAVLDDDCITSIQLKISSLGLRIWNESSCFNIELGQGIVLQSDNFANDIWIDRTFIKIPNIFIQTLACLDEHIWYEVMKISTSFAVSMYKKDPGSSDIALRQRLYVEENDTFKRCSHIFTDQMPSGKLTQKRFAFYNYNPPFKFVDKPAASAPSFFDHGEAKDETEEYLNYSDVNIKDEYDQ